MAGTIKGITVEIGGDTTKLSKALDGTNSQIKSTQSELKKVEKLLKLDPTNTELLRQKQVLLSQAVSETKEKLVTLKEAEKQVQQQVKEGKASQEQYSALQREIISTEQSLKSLASQAGKSNVTLEQVGTVAGKVADKTKALSLAAGGALTAMGAAAVKAGARADDLNTLAKQTGLTTAELQKMQYASDIVDVSVESITGALKKMKKNMASSSGDVQAAWETIGVSATNADGSMRNATDVFYEALQGLSKVGNETKRDQLAMTLFGKSADELAGIVDDGGASLKQMGQEAEDAGLILSQDTLDSANEFNDSIDKLKATASQSFSKIGADLATMLIPALDKVCGFAEKVVDWFTNLSPAGKGVIITVLALIAAISPVAGMIQAITTITGILTAIKTAHAAATAVETAATAGATAAQGGLNLAFLACPLTWIILLIVGLIAAFILLWNNCEGFRNFWIGLWESIKQIAGAVGDWFVATWDSISTWFANLWEGIKQFPGAAWEAIKSAWLGAASWYNNSVIKPINDFFSRMWDGITYGAKMVWYGIQVGAISMVNFVIKCLNAMIKGILTPFNVIIKGLNKIPGVDIKQISWSIPTIALPEMPKMAKGGILSKGSALVGENGPEVLTVGSGKAQVTPLNGNNTNTPIGDTYLTFTVPVDGQPIAQSTYKFTNGIAGKGVKTVARGMGIS